MIVSDRTSKKYQDGSEARITASSEKYSYRHGCKKMVPFEHLENCYLSFRDEYRDQ